MPSWTSPWRRSATGFGGRAAIGRTSVVNGFLAATPSCGKTARSRTEPSGASATARSRSPSRRTIHRRTVRSCARTGPYGALPQSASTATGTDGPGASSAPRRASSRACVLRPYKPSADQQAVGRPSPNDAVSIRSSDCRTVHLRRPRPFHRRGGLSIGAVRHACGSLREGVVACRSGPEGQRAEVTRPAPSEPTRWVVDGPLPRPRRLP